MCHSFPYSNAFKGLKNIFVEFVTFSVQGYFKKKDHSYPMPRNYKETF